MIVRYLPLILILSAIVLTLAPIEAAARDLTQATPSADPVSTTANPVDRQARPKKAGALVNSGSSRKRTPPGADSREVRPAEAFPPERIQTPQASSRGGVEAPAIAPKDDPRSIEERKDPGD